MFVIFVKHSCHKGYGVSVFRYLCESFLITRFVKILKKLCRQAEKQEMMAMKGILLGLSDFTYYIESLHEDLVQKLKPAADVYLKQDDNKRFDFQQENVADVFVSMFSRFLMYAPFIVHCDNVEKVIGLMKVDESVRKDVKSLEDFLQAEMEREKKGNMPTSFNSLLAFPFQHVIR